MNGIVLGPADQACARFQSLSKKMTSLRLVEARRLRRVKVGQFLQRLQPR